MTGIATAMDFKIKPFKPENLVRLLEIDRMCFPADESFSLDEFIFYIYMLRSETLVAEMDDKICGFLTLSEIDEGIWELVTIDVLSEYRRAGLGGNLLEKGVKLIKRFNPKEVRLHVRTDNEGAIKLYTNHGFTVVKKIKNYYNGKKDAILMLKEFFND